MIYCLDYLGGGKYPEIILREHPAGWGAGIFTQKELFKDGVPVMQKLADTGRCPLIRFNLRWSDTHTFSQRDFPAIVKEARRCLPIVQAHPEMRFYFSGATEHQLDKNTAEALSRAVLDVLPERCIYVNNPWEGKGAFITPGPRIIQEVHGSKAHAPKAPFGFSWDGSSCLDANVQEMKERMAAAEYFMWWFSSCNGRLNDNDKTPRNQRRAWPTSQLIDSVIYLHRDKGDFKNLGAKWIYKTHADRHSTPPEPRAYKPVLICPEAHSRFEMVADNGQVIAVSGPRGKYTDGRPLYRFDRFGFELAEKARRIQGHSVVTLRAGGRTFGKVNPAFRAGDYR